AVLYGGWENPAGVPSRGRASASAAPDRAEISYRAHHSQYRGASQTGGPRPPLRLLLRPGGKRTAGSLRGRADLGPRWQREREPQRQRAGEQDAHESASGDCADHSGSRHPHFERTRLSRARRSRRRVEKLCTGCARSHFQTFPARRDPVAGASQLRERSISMTGACVKIGNLRMAIVVAAVLFGLNPVEPAATILFPYREAQSDGAEARFERGLQLAQAGELPAAEQELRAAVKLRASDPEYLTSLATVLAIEKKIEESTFLFEKALKIRPSDWRSRRDLSANLWQLRRYAEAKRHLK